MTDTSKVKAVPAVELSQAEAEGLLQSLKEVQSDLEALCRHGQAVRESVREFVENVERHFHAN
jgi:exo-beta-1,3-glucanase (GH17 family)